MPAPCIPGCVGEHVSNITTAIAEAVRRRREQLGITQEQLAQRAHLNRTYISDIERGTRNFSVGIFDRLATALSMSASALWHLAEEGRAQLSQGPDGHTDGTGDGDGEIAKVATPDDKTIE
jgi:transcriptional regulator with XRE-family HTH domain